MKGNSRHSHKAGEAAAQTAPAANRMLTLRDDQVSDLTSVAACLVNFLLPVSSFLFPGTILKEVEAGDRQTVEVSL